MTFNQIHEDVSCICTTDASEDHLSQFGLFTNKMQLSEKDFRTKWEKGKRAVECPDVCGFKGLSMSKITSDNLQQVKEIFNAIFTSAPQYKRFISIIKINPDSGLVKETPLFNNPYHHDFYKCDKFTFNSVQVISTEPLVSLNV